MSDADWHEEVKKRNRARSSKSQAKVEKTMHEFKHHELHSGSKQGPKVHSRAQAIAIALKQAGKSKHD
jgi:hypothetical protein